MLDGVDVQKDAMGIIRHEEFVCGDCKHAMIPIGTNRYQCPHCGKVMMHNKPQAAKCEPANAPSPPDTTPTDAPEST